MAWNDTIHTKKRKVIRPNITSHKAIISYLLTIYTSDRCLLCPDGSCLFADLSLGDFWCQDYSGEFNKMTNSTLVVQRTRRGNQALRIAEKQNLIQITELPETQKSRRLIRVFKHKRNLAVAFIKKKRKSKQPYPRYHFNISRKMTMEQFRALYFSSYYIFSRLKKNYLFRKLFLRFFFSKAGLIFSKTNALKRKVLFKYK